MAGLLSVHADLSLVQVRDEHAEVASLRNQVCMLLDDVIHTLHDKRRFLAGYKAGQEAQTTARSRSHDLVTAERMSAFEHIAQRSMLLRAGVPDICIEDSLKMIPGGMLWPATHIQHQCTVLQGSSKQNAAEYCCMLLVIYQPPLCFAKAAKVLAPM
jgi:hypothetical protein